MHASSTKCDHEGCSRPKTAHSVFCKEHHREQLKRVGLIPDAPADPRTGIRERCERLLRAFEQNAITKEELCSNLFDRFIYDSVSIGMQPLSAGLDSLPRAIVLDLLAYARTHSAPRVFHPLPDDRQQRVELERKTLEVQTVLIARLDEKSRQPNVAAADGAGVTAAVVRERVRCPPGR